MFPERTRIGGGNSGGAEKGEGFENLAISLTATLSPVFIEYFFQFQHPLDDWKLNNLDVHDMGEYKAFNEFLENNTQLEAQEIKSYNRKSRSFILQPKLSV